MPNWEAAMELVERLLRPIRLATLFPVFVYQVLLSPMFGRGCRFRPTCSNYAFGAVLKHGVIRGWSLAIWRLLRCNPYNAGGDDPVP
jgi:putative membrane protein insertion efficiency factor